MISPQPQNYLIQTPEQSEEWHWPVDLTLHQHAPSLWERELQEIDQVMKWRALPRVLPLLIQQMFQPVQEALDASHANPRMRHDVRRVLLIEMHRRRRSFWDWTAEEWFEILCNTATAFAKRYPGAAMCRQQVLTIAYLLCGFTEFHKLGAFLRKTLADTTFGAARMEETIQRVIGGARQWGLIFREDLALSSVVREALLLNRSPKFLVLVEGKANPQHYWLSLEVIQQTKLARLDQFLRTAWLECCGHLSAFTIGETRYCIDAGMGEEWEEESLIDEQPMDIPIRRVLEPGQQCDYEYDYGSTTFLSIQVIAAYTGIAGGPSVRLLARNDPPRVWCQNCGRVATLVCTLCLDDHHFGQEGWFCQKCASKHDCGRDMMLPVVNSPRTGVCGYTG